MSWPRHADPLALLTPMERACLRLVAQRCSSRVIAAELGIAKTSVDTYCNRARQKLGVSDRYAAARLLMEQATTAPAAPPPAPRAAPRPPTLGLRLGVAAAALTATALALGSLLAGMAALDALKPPGLHEPPAAGSEARGD